MIMRFILFIVFAALVQSATAGPWLREKGKGFISTSVTGNYYFDTTNQIFLEYGLTDKTTVIADVSFLRPRFAIGGGNATLSIRRALTKLDATSKWAYELGVGAGWVGDDVLPNIRTALTWGRGVKWGEKNGWATVEASGLWDVTYGQHVMKLDSTIGMNFTDVTAVMLQLYTARFESGSIATIAPSIILTHKKSKFRLQIGAESQIGNRENSAIKLSLWRDF